MAVQTPPTRRDLDLLLDRLTKARARHKDAVRKADAAYEVVCALSDAAYALYCDVRQAEVA